MSTRMHNLPVCVCVCEGGAVDTICPASAALAFSPSLPCLSPHPLPPSTPPGNIPGPPGSGRRALRQLRLPPRRQLRLGEGVQRALQRRELQQLQGGAQERPGACSAKRSVSVQEHRGKDKGGAGA